MTSAYLAISFLKQTSLPEKQLRIFFFFFPQEPLKEYLFNSDILIGKRNMSKNDLIDMIITEKSKKISYTQEDDNLTKDEANESLKNISFPKLSSKENINLINTPEIKTIKH